MINLTKNKKKKKRDMIKTISCTEDEKIYL